MSDRDIPNSSEKKTRTKMMPGEQYVPREQGVKRNFVDITVLIRSIQLAEGNRDCFRRAEGYCDQMTCGWRTYCLENQKAP